jgi:hypothetical protein
MKLSKRYLLVLVSIFYFISPLYGSSISDNITYKMCSERDEIILRRWINRRVLSVGLTRLYKLNTFLYERAREQLANRKLQIYCSKSNSGLASYRPAGFFRTARIYFGKILKSVRILDQAPNPDRKVLDRIDNIIFHELLHFFEFDNIEPADHNYLSNYGNEEDIVYACAGAVFDNFLIPAFNKSRAIEVCSCAQAGDLRF